MRTLISFLVPLVLLGTTLGTRMAAQALEQALLSMVIDRWPYIKRGNRLTSTDDVCRPDRVLSGGTTKQSSDPSFNTWTRILCWCDPIIEVDAEGQELVLHRQVTWN